MSKIKRLEQLANENSLYRVSGVFAKSEVCRIAYTSWGYSFSPVLKGRNWLAYYDELALAKNLYTGNISIMCLQRGE